MCVCVLVKRMHNKIYFMKKKKCNFQMVKYFYNKKYLF